MKTGKPILKTILELGHTTSKKLGYAYDLGGSISYGEETITETNLLELKQCHPKLVHIETFSKAVESKLVGADWEWHIIGKYWTLKMRVQAKRVDKFGNIKNLNHQSKKAPMPQIDTLIKSAKNDGLLPIYCFYCAEKHRKFWKLGSLVNKHENEFETGCLIADADQVLKISPSKLSDIEQHSIPWHFIWADKRFSFLETEYNLRYSVKREPARYAEEIYTYSFDRLSRCQSRLELPIAHELNSKNAKLNENVGVYKTDVETSVFRQDYFAERQINRVVILDVRERQMLEFMSRPRPLSEN